MTELLAPITMTMGEFMRRDNPVTEHSIYILWYGKAGTQALYVGISRDNVWNRWFYRDGCHITLYKSGNMQGNTTVGQAVANNRPESLAWEIEFRDYDYLNQRLERVERELIKELRPLLNYVNGVDLTNDEAKLMNKLTDQSSKQDMTSAPCDVLGLRLYR